MPLARWAVYEGGPQIWLAPNADDSDGWIASMRHIAIEAGAFVVSVPQYIPADRVPRRLPAAAAGRATTVFGRGGVVHRVADGRGDRPGRCTTPRASWSPTAISATRCTRSGTSTSPGTTAGPTSWPGAAPTPTEARSARDCQPEVRGDRRGDGRDPERHRAAPRRLRRHHGLREGRLVRRHVAGEHLPRARVRRAVAPLLVLVRAEPRLDAHVLGRRRDPRVLRAGRRRPRRRARRALRRRGGRLHVRRRPLGDRDRVRAPRHRRRRDRGHRRAAPSEPPGHRRPRHVRGRDVPQLPVGPLGAARRRPRRCDRHRVDRGADHGRAGRAGPGTSASSSAPRSGCCPRPTTRTPRRSARGTRRIRSCCARCTTTSPRRSARSRPR